MATMRLRTLGPVLLLVLGGGACGGGGGGTAQEAPGPNPFTVQGTVLKQQMPQSPPVPDGGASVVIEGHAEVVTDGSGRFTVPDVSSPYSVIVFDAGREDVAVYVGLTRSDPVLHGTPPGATALRSTWATGDVTGGIGWPLPAGYETIVSYGSPGWDSQGHVFPDTNDGSYEYSITWAGAATIPVTGAALQWQTGSEGPASYTGFGVVTADATDGVLLSPLDIPLDPVAAQTVNGTLEVGAGLGSVTAGMTARLGGGPALSVWMGNRTAGPFAALVPVLPNATLWLSLGASAPTGEYVLVWRAVEPGDTGLTLRLPEPVRQLEPPDGTTGVAHDTEFRVTELVGRVVQVRYVPVFPSDGPALLLTTGGSTWTVPDLSLYGIVLPPASEYAWSVTGHGSAAVDDLCDPSPFSSRPARYETHASWREFTTAP